MAGRRALVLGASGLVGSRCVAHLQASDAYELVTCLVRRPILSDRAGSRETRATQPEKVRERVVDLSKLTGDDVEPYDDLFCAIGTTMKKAGSREAFRWVDHDLPLRVAELGVGRGTKRIALVSSAGASARSSNFYLRTKGELEEALARLPLDALHILRPSLLLGERSESRPGEAIASVVARATRGLLVGSLRKWRPIDGDRVA
ncbi:MAG TPA: NAD-dependent epimerase/dehydratase family protein, partial [Labilithrix sp.]|nr:NAD-dependent epimerase/dehydratase family protein [Labilithrix sp.]